MYVIFFLLLGTVLSANILHIGPVGSRSHHIWNSALALGLVEKGHNVTLLTHTDEKQKINNFHIILLEGLYKKTFETVSTQSPQKSGPLSDIVALYDFALFCCEHDFGTQGFKTIMKYPKDFKFDLIVIDITIQQCFYPLIERFNNPPVVAVTPLLIPPVLAHSFGNPLQTAYMPYFSTKHTDRMTFLQRIKNFLLIYCEILYRRYIATPSEMNLARKHFGSSIQPFSEVERNMSILISNYDPVLSFPLSLPPNIIPAGGLHVRPIKPLPNDIKTIIDNAKHGVILFTLGSFVKSDQLSVDTRTEIINAFAKLPQTILWKFESPIDNLPENVVVREWLPQSDILGNPKTKLFITHGGALGTQEAMHHGVPVVVIPFYSDQYTNANMLTVKKMGLTVYYNEITTEHLHSSITEVINNPEYAKNIKKISQRFKDRPEDSLTRAVFWVEYVLRHGDAKFLDLASRDMPIYQAASYDVILALIMGVYLFYSLFSFIYTCCKLLFKPAHS